MAAADLAHLHPIALAAQEIDSILQTVFPRLPAGEAIGLWQYLRAYMAHEDTPLFNEGDAGDYMLFTVEGIVKVTKEDVSGPSVVALLSRGDSLGEMGLIDGAPRSAACVALHECVFAVLTRADFQRLREEQPRLALEVLTQIATTLSTRLRRATQAGTDSSLDPFAM
jgi:CRP/FNR family transcriptional regulator, cyclic AMP receptor protein